MRARATVSEFNEPKTDMTCSESDQTRIESLEQLNERKGVKSNACILGVRITRLPLSVRMRAHLR